ncbi:MAG: proline racemase family protein [Planctomycetota bacterium]
MLVHDSHTAGEPTRVLLIDDQPGDPNQASRLAPLIQWLRALPSDPTQAHQALQADDRLRRLLIDEPRGSEILVGAIVWRMPDDDPSDFGLVFFNNVGYLGMCGHGLIGIVETLRASHHVDAGPLRFATPVGEVQVILHDDHSVSFTNVASYRSAAAISVDVPGYGVVTGDIAWGGNWFFLTDQLPPSGVGRASLHPNDADLELLSDYCRAIRTAINQDPRSGTMKEMALVDHVELFAASASSKLVIRNFVLCPGFAYDRSPCGTGTSAKLACMFADGTLLPDQTSEVIGIRDLSFRVHYSREHVSADGKSVRPTIRGRAFMTGHIHLALDTDDPLANGN